ncbi:MAG: hypothetical protein ABF289_03170 [Clostridiales bacterium]
MERGNKNLIFINSVLISFLLISVFGIELTVFLSLKTKIESLESRTLYILIIWGIIFFTILLNSSIIFMYSLFSMNKVIGGIYEQEHNKMSFFRKILNQNKLIYKNKNDDVKKRRPIKKKSIKV